MYIVKDLQVLNYFPSNACQYMCIYIYTCENVSIDMIAMTIIINNWIFLSEIFSLTFYTRELHFNYLPNFEKYDHTEIVPFDYEPNVIQFGSQSKGKLSS